MKVIKTDAGGCGNCTRCNTGTKSSKEQILGRWDEMTRDAAESAPCTVSVLYGIGDRQLSVKYLKRV